MRALLVAIPLLLFAMMAPAQDRAADYWPGEAWRESTPEQQGLDSAKLAEMFDYIRQNNINIHSVLAIRNGYVVLDASFWPYDGTTVHDLASCTKSVTATLIGAAINRGKIKSVDDRVLSYFPGRKTENPDARKDALRIRDLLTMSSGLDCDASHGEVTLREMMQSPDWTQFMLNRRIVADAGTKFVYCSGGMHLLSSLLSRATGGSAEAFARRELFEPLGIRDWIWPADSQGVNHGWGDLHLKPRDMARIGYLYLHGGVWNGRRILPEEYFTSAVQPLMKTGGNSDYGYGWWAFTGARMGEFEAVGRGGQRIVVNPKANAVVVFTGGGFEPGDPGKFIGEAVRSNSALPENPAAVARLNAAIEAARRPGTQRAVVEVPQSRLYELAANPLGLKSFRFAPGSVLYLAFTDGRKEERPIGVDGNWRVSANGRYGLPVAVRGHRENDVVVLEYNEIANINSFVFRIKFDGDTAQIAISEQTGVISPLTIEAKASVPPK